MHDTKFPVGDFRNDYFRGTRKIDVQERVNHIWNDVKDTVDSRLEAALRYIISFGAVTTVIPGMRSEKKFIG